MISTSGKNFFIKAKRHNFPKEGIHLKDFIEYGFFKYKLLPDDTLCLTAYRGNDREVTVPEKVMQYTVTEIAASAFSFNGGVTKITLPETITKLERYCFSECVSLTEINIPAGVTDIPPLAFDDCLSLERVFLENKSCIIDPKTFNCTLPEII